MGLTREWYKQETVSSEEEQAHRPQGEEISFYQAVSSGDIDAVRRNCEQKRFLEKDGVGVLSRNSITNLKYHFVITAALITRNCVERGMEMEKAFRLSDFYILKLDSKPITACLEYIYAHIKERITIEDLAAHTQLSTSYLSRLFKEEIGISVSDYIREKKVEKAQNLLKYCDFSLIEIANYLSFSSQSHFIQSFKKLVGMTPKKYRDIYYSTGWIVTEPRLPGADK